MEIIERAFKHVKKNGFVSLVKIVVEKVLNFIFYYRQEHLFSLTLSNFIPNTGLDNSIKVRLAVKEDIAVLEKEVYKNAYLFEKWIDNGSLFFCAFNEDEIIGYLSMSSKPVDHWSVNLNLKYLDIYEHDVFVLSDYRGRNVFQRIITEIVSILNEKGYNRVICTIPSNNYSSVNAHKKCGFERIGEVKQIRIMGVEKFYVSGMSYKNDNNA